METPVKERLIGAAILVGLIVVLVPEMLSGPKESETHGSPQSESPTRSYTIDLSRSGQVTSTEITEEKPPVAPTPAPQAKPASTPAAAVPPAAQGGREADPTPRRTEHEQPAPKPVTAAAPAQGWAVQTGSFGSAANARKLVSDLRAKGYKAFISTSGTGSAARHRVRVGPEPSRSAAQKLAQRLKGDGQQVTVVSHP